MPFELRLRKRSKFDSQQCGDVSSLKLAVHVTVTSGKNSELTPRLFDLSEGNTVARFRPLPLESSHVELTPSETLPCVRDAPT